MYTLVTYIVANPVPKTEFQPSQSIIALYDRQRPDLSLLCPIRFSDLASEKLTVAYWFDLNLWARTVLQGPIQLSAHILNERDWSLSKSI